SFLLWFRYNLCFKLFPYTTLFRSEFSGSEVRFPLKRAAYKRTVVAGALVKIVPPRARRSPMLTVVVTSYAPRNSSAAGRGGVCRSEEHTSELQSLRHLVCRLLLEK